MIGDGPLKPLLSVIIASYNSGDTIEACLSSLYNQETELEYEVIVVDSSTDGTPGIVSEKYPEVNLYSFNERKFCGDARNFGFSVAKGEIIAFLDADCVVDSNWVNKIVEAHQLPHPVIGGVIDNGSRDSAIGWAYYFCEFNLWLPHLAKKEIKEIAGCCMSLKRTAFEKYGPFLEGTYCSDTAFHWKLLKDGHKVLSVPSIRVYHRTTSGFVSFMKHIAGHRRNFAEVKVKEQGLSKLKRASFIFLFPFLPFILLLVISKRVISSGVYLRQFVLAAPLVFMGSVARAWGELLGYTITSKKR